MRFQALAACALLLGAASPSQTPPGNQPQAEADHAHAAQAHRAPAAPATAPATVQQVINSPTAAEGGGRDKKQPEQPGWIGEWTFYATAAQAVVGVLGLVGLFATVLYAKRAWLAAERAFRSSERPWLVLDTFEISEPMAINPDGFSTLGKIIIKNVGKTVALNTIWSTVVHTKRIANSEEASSQLEAEGLRSLAASRKMGGMLLAPGDTMEIGFGVNLRAKHLEGSTHPLDGSINPFVIGTVTYRSPNDADPHQTTFTLLIRRKAQGKGPFPHPPIHLTGGTIPLDQLEVIRWYSGYTAT